MKLDEWLSKPSPAPCSVAAPHSYAIDEMLRIIKVPEDAVVIGVEGDKEVNEVSFTVPRFYKGLDLSGFSIQVNYVNAGGELGFYPVSGPRHDEDSIDFSWIVEEPATRFKGDVRFAVRFYRASKDGVVSQAFNTTIGTASCLEGIDVDGALPEGEIKSLLEQFTGRIEETIKRSDAGEAARADAESARAAAETDRAKSSKAATDAANAATADARELLSVLSPTAGNLPRGTMSGEAASADDCFGHKPLAIAARGVTKRNLWMSPVGSGNGLVLSQDDDGSMSISGTAARDAYFSAEAFALDPKRSYRITINKAIGTGDYSSMTAAAGVRWHRGDAIAGSKYVGYGDKLSDVLPADNLAKRAQLIVFIKAGTTLNVSGVRVHLTESEGGQAEWSRPGLSGAEPKSVAASGGNLFAIKNATENGVALKTNPDGTVTLGGAPTTQGFTMGMTDIPMFAGARVHAGVDKSTSDDNACVFQLNFFDKLGNQIEYNAITQSGNTFTAPHGTVMARMQFALFGRESFRAGTYRPWASFSEGGWTPPTWTSATAIDLKSSVLRSLPDGTRDELRIDGDGRATLVQRVGAIVVSGVEKAFSSGVSSNGAHRYIVEMLQAAPGRSYVFGANNAVSDRLIHHPDYSGLKPSCFYTQNASLVFGSDKETDAEFVKWVNSVSPTVYYPLADPKTIDLGTIAVPKLPQGAAHVWAGSEVAPELDVKYIRDINIVIKKLEQAIVACTSNL